MLNIRKGAHVALFDRIAGHGGDGDGHVLQTLRHATGGHDNVLNVLRRRRFGGVSSRMYSWSRLLHCLGQGRRGHGGTHAAKRNDETR